MDIRAIIVDDESKLREVLKIKLGKYCPGINIIAEAENASTAFDKISQLKPDLVFLDIAMPGESGFDLLERFDHIDFEIIFVTGFSDYVIDALRVSAVDYIIKPIKTELLMESVERAKERITKASIIARYEVLKYNLKNINKQKIKLAIPGMQAYEFVKVEDIVRCESWKSSTKIHLVSGDVIVSSYNIEVFEKMLNVYDFFSTHKSHLINTNHIERYLIDGTIVMDDESNVPVARLRREQFMTTVVRNKN